MELGKHLDALTYPWYDDARPGGAFSVAEVSAGPPPLGEFSLLVGGGTLRVCVSVRIFPFTIAFFPLLFPAFPRNPLPPSLSGRTYPLLPLRFPWRPWIRREPPRISRGRGEDKTLEHWRSTIAAPKVGASVHRPRGPSVTIRGTAQQRPEPSSGGEVERARAVRAVTGLAGGGGAAYTEASALGTMTAGNLSAAATFTAPFYGELSLSGRICIRGRGTYYWSRGGREIRAGALRVAA